MWFPQFPTMSHLCHNQNTLHNGISLRCFWSILTCKYPKVEVIFFGIIQNKIKEGFWVELIKPLLKRPYKMDHAKQALRPISCSKVQSNFMYTYQGWF